MTSTWYDSIPWPPADDWEVNTPSYMGIYYPDGPDSDPAVVAVTGVHRHLNIQAFSIDVDNGFGLDSLWTYVTGDSTSGGGGHLISALDVDLDGNDEILVVTLCFDGDGTLLWYLGKEGHPDGNDGNSVGHADWFSVADIDPSVSGFEVAFGIERGSARNPEGDVYLVEAFDGNPLWVDDETMMQHADEGFVGEIDTLSADLEIVAYSQIFDRWRGSTVPTDPSRGRTPGAASVRTIS